MGSNRVTIQRSFDEDAIADVLLHEDVLERFYLPDEPICIPFHPNCFYLMARLNDDIAGIFPCYIKDDGFYMNVGFLPKYRGKIALYAMRELIDWVKSHLPEKKMRCFILSGMKDVRRYAASGGFRCISKNEDKYLYEIPQ